jgi:release factor glutamine methyltransferase
MSARAMIDAAAAKLEAAGIETPRLDAELLLAHCVGASRGEIVAGLVEVEGVEQSYEEAIARRAEREPLAYITGRQGFRRIELKVDPRALIPRPETELLVELALARKPKIVIDVATGSGAIALALADEIDDHLIVGADTSIDALDLARENREALGAEQVWFLNSDLLLDIDYIADVIVANLPYIPAGELDDLQPEVARFEPREALDGGEDGLKLVRKLARQALGKLKPGGMLALEIGEGQAAETEEILRAAGFGDIERHKDLAGIERVVLGFAPR